MRRGKARICLADKEPLVNTKQANNTTMAMDPFAGDVFVFRSRIGSLFKALWHDGLGLSLYAKQLDRGRFVWPHPVDGVLALNAGQMSYLLEGIDWRNPQQTWRLQSAG